ncbi:MAG TPA: PIN domain-containing protein [Thermoanaerobaculia bacterium]|nr:PIN domain-containing protein [Thermoanaerobaculia bacterium]
MLRAVIDTNVLFAGLSQRGAEGSVVDAWVARRFRPCVSTALALEYRSVLERKFGDEKREGAVKALQALLDRCEYVPIRFTYRPASPDPGDDLVVDCILNSRAVLVTANVKDFRRPAEELRFSLFRPEEFLSMLREDER